MCRDADRFLSGITCLLFIQGTLTIQVNVSVSSDVAVHGRYPFNMTCTYVFGENEPPLHIYTISLARKRLEDRKFILIVEFEGPDSEKNATYYDNELQSRTVATNPTTSRPRASLLFIEIRFTDEAVYEWTIYFGDGRSWYQTKVIYIHFLVKELDASSSTELTLTPRQTTEQNVSTYFTATSTEKYISERNASLTELTSIVGYTTEQDVSPSSPTSTTTHISERNASPTELTSIVGYTTEQDVSPSSPTSTTTHISGGVGVPTSYNISLVIGVGIGVVLMFVTIVAFVAGFICGKKRIKSLFCMCNSDPLNRNDIYITPTEVRSSSAVDDTCAVYEDIKMHGSVTKDQTEYHTVREDVKDNIQDTSI